MGEMLKIENIRKVFNAGTINEKVALDGVNLTLEEGEFVTVIGGNGAGKSTTLNAVAGVWPVDSGKIYIGGDDVTKLSEYKRAKYLGRVFQDPMTGTATTMSIEENMAIAARRGRSRGLSWGITKQERDKYREMLATLNLHPGAGNYAGKAGAGGPSDLEGRTAFRRTASGNYTANGIHSEAEASPSG